MSGMEIEELYQWPGHEACQVMLILAISNIVQPSLVPITGLQKRRRLKKKKFDPCKSGLKMLVE